MIKIQTFPVDKYEDANKFLSLHAARGSSAGNSSMLLHEGNLVIFYDDGIGMSPAEKISSLQNLLREEEGKRLLSIFQVNSILLILNPLLPKGYKQEMADYQLKKLIQEQHETLAVSMVNDIVKKIISLENEAATSRFTLAKVEFSIEALHKMIEEQQKLLKS